MITGQRIAERDASRNRGRSHDWREHNHRRRPSRHDPKVGRDGSGGNRPTHPRFSQLVAYEPSPARPTLTPGLLVRKGRSLRV